MAKACCSAGQGCEGESRQEQRDEGQGLGKSSSSCWQLENPSELLSMLPTYPGLSLSTSGVVELRKVSAPYFCLLLQKVLKVPTGNTAPKLRPQNCQNSLAWVWTVLSSNPAVTLCTLRRSPAGFPPSDTPAPGTLLPGTQHSALRISTGMGCSSASLLQTQQNTHIHREQ